MTAGRSCFGASTDWNTPPEYVLAVRSALHGEIDLDPCSNAFSMVGARRSYALPHEDGLALLWDARAIFVNPPYGRSERGVRAWLRRCHLAAQAGASVIALVPVATNTTHWKVYVFPSASAICFLSATRVGFWINGAPTPKGAPMACAMIYWGDAIDVFHAAFTPHGHVVKLK